ncbi:MAG: glycosyltransferase family 39 protein [Actinomycetota bacterium]
MTSGNREGESWVSRLALLLGCFFVFHLLKNLFLGVHPDEANWWMQSRNLSAGYYFHPPFTAYMVRAGTLVFGDGSLGLRMAHLLFATASLGLLFLLCRELGLDGRWSFLSTLLVAFLPFANYWMTMVVVDTPMILFSLLFSLFAWRAVRRGNGNYWYLAGLAAGFMLLCKLQSAFYILGLFLFLLTYPASRAWLRRREPYIGLALALLVMVPTLAWYARHRFQPIFSQLTSRPGFLHGGPGEYLVEVAKHVAWEALVLTPFVYLFSLFGLVYGCWRGFLEKRDQLLFPFWLALPGFAFFTITGGPPRWGFSFHLYSLVLAMVCAAAILRESSQPSARRLWTAIYGVLFLAPCLTLTLLSLYLAAGSSLQTGWKEVAEEVRKEAWEAREKWGENPVVASPYYFISSEIAYHNRGEDLECTIAFRVYENEVMCDDSTYSPWVPLKDLVGRDFLFVDEKDNPDGFQTPISYWERKLVAYFREVSDPVVLRLGGERELYIFFCRGFEGPSGDMDERGEVRRYLEGTAETPEDSAETRSGSMPTHSLSTRRTPNSRGKPQDKPPRSTSRMES